MSLLHASWLSILTLGKEDVCEQEKKVGMIVKNAMNSCLLRDKVKSYGFLPFNLFRSPNFHK